MRALEDNADLLARYQSGDRKALLLVYETYAKAVGDFLLSLRPSAEFDLEDAVQETFMRAFGASARARYDGKGNFKNFLFTIARNLLIDAQRKRRPRSTLSPEALEAPMRPDEHADRAELERLVRSFIETLSNTERDVLKKRFTEGRSQAQTAVALGLGRQRVRTLELKLRKRLFIHLSDSGYLHLKSGRQAGGATTVAIAIIGGLL